MKLVLILLAVVTLFEVQSETSWNQFRGPSGSGVFVKGQPPLRMDPSLAAWRAPLAPGQSSPVIQGDLLVITALEDGKQLVTLAFDKVSGKQRWRKPAPECALEKVHEAGSPAASTPYVDMNRVYVYFGSFGLLCYDHGGNEIWKKSIPTPKSLYGMSTSPIVHENKLIMVLDNDSNLPDSDVSQSRIIALDKTNGELIWETPRPFNRSGWSTPTVLRNRGGSDELVVLGHGRVYGYDADTGVEKWFVNGFSRETIARPVTGNGMVFVSASMLGGVADEDPDREPFWKALLPFDTNNNGKIERHEMTRDFTFPLRPDLPIGHPGFGIPLPQDQAKRTKRQDGFLKWVDKNKDGAWTKEELLNHLSFNRGKPNLMAIRPGGSGDVSESHVSWALHRNIPEIPSPIFYQDRIYMVRNGGILTCVNALSGETLYKKRLGATGQYGASPIISGGHLYLVSNEGLFTLVPVGDKFDIAYQHDLKTSITATPAIDANSIYVRTSAGLTAYR